jgi:hypothetical protein
MHYDVTILTVLPGTTPKALPQLNQWLSNTRLGGKLLACWFSELGALNQILLIHEYDSEPAIAVDRDAIVRSGNPYGVADMITAASSDTYASFPFLPPMQARSAGPFFEVRTYLLKPAGLDKTIELWRATVPNRVKLSPLLAAMYSLIGGGASCTSGPTRASMSASASAPRPSKMGYGPQPAVPISCSHSRPTYSWRRPFRRFIDDLVRAEAPD